jgi:hypothetical protein
VARNPGFDATPELGQFHQTRRTFRLARETDAKWPLILKKGARSGDEGQPERGLAGIYLYFELLIEPYRKLASIEPLPI